jgi:hypothetical protein
MLTAGLALVLIAHAAAGCANPTGPMSPSESPANGPTSPTQPSTAPSSDQPGYLPGTWSSICRAFAAFQQSADELAVWGRASRLGDRPAAAAAGVAAERALQELEEHAKTLTASDLTRSLATRFSNAARDRRVAADAIRQDAAGVREVRVALDFDSRARAEIERARGFSALVANTLDEGPCPAPPGASLTDPTAGIEFRIPDGWTAGVGTDIDEMQTPPTASLQVTTAIAQARSSTSWTTFGFDRGTLDARGDRVPLLVGVNSVATRDPSAEYAALAAEIEATEGVASSASFGVALGSGFGGGWFDVSMATTGGESRLVIFAITADDRLIGVSFVMEVEDAASYLFEQLAFLDTVVVSDATE